MKRSSTRKQLESKQRIWEANQNDPRHVCVFSSRGTTHKTYVTDATGQRFVDTTKVQRCKCGERKVSRVSRVPIE